MLNVAKIWKRKRAGDDYRPCSSRTDTSTYVPKRYRFMTSELPLKCLVEKSKCKVYTIYTHCTPCERPGANNITSTRSGGVRVHLLVPCADYSPFTCDAMISKKSSTPKKKKGLEIFNYEIAALKSKGETDRQINHNARLYTTSDL